VVGEAVRPTGDAPPLGHQALKSLNAEGLGLCEVREEGSSAVPLGTPLFVLRPFGKYVKGFSACGIGIYTIERKV
jgi:hypothetical protein